jgi:hypothetical protein
LTRESPEKLGHTLVKEDLKTLLSEAGQKTIDVFALV